MTLLAKTAETLGKNLRGEAYGYVHASDDKPKGQKPNGQSETNGHRPAPPASHGVLVVSPVARVLGLVSATDRTKVKRPSLSPDKALDAMETTLDSIQAIEEHLDRIGSVAKYANGHTEDPSWMVMGPPKASTYKKLKSEIDCAAKAARMDNINLIDNGVKALSLKMGCGDRMQFKVPQIDLTTGPKGLRLPAVYVGTYNAEKVRLLHHRIARARRRLNWAKTTIDRSAQVIRVGYVTYSPLVGGHAPRYLRRIFEQSMTALLNRKEGEPEPKVEIDRQVRRIGHVFGILWNCTDIVPEQHLKKFDLPKGMSYAKAARKLRAKL